MTEPNEVSNVRNVSDMASFNAFGVATLLDGQRVNIQMTMRHGMTSELASKDLDNFIAFLEHAAGMGIKLDAGKAVAPPAAAPPAMPKAVQEAMKEGDNETAAVMQAAIEDIGDPPAGKQWKTFDAVVVEILPQPDERVNINFYGNQHKQPHDEYAGVKVTKWKLDSAAGLIKHICSNDVSVPAKLTLPCRVFYTDGKEYTKTDGGKANYKDIAHVRLLP